MVSSCDLNVTLAVAPSGWSVYLICLVPPTFTLRGSIVIPVGTIATPVTVTSHVPFTSATSVVTSIFTVPSFTPVTLPCASTVAMVSSCDLNVTLAVAPSGWSVYLICLVLPISTLSGSIAIPVSSVLPSSTVTLHVPLTVGTSVVIKISTVPAFTPFTLPLSSTVAIVSSCDLKETRDVEPAGWRPYLIGFVSPIFTLRGSIVMPVAGLLSHAVFVPVVWISLWSS